MPALIIDEDRTIGADETLNLVDPTLGIDIQGAWDLVNSGTVTVAPDGPSSITGILAAAGSSFTNGATGEFSVTAPFADESIATGFAAAGAATFVNDGLFEVTAYEARGVTGGGFSLDFTNTGTIAVEGRTIEVGVNLNGGGSFSNSGTIEATTSGLTAIGVALSGVVTEFVNTADGRIAAYNNGNSPESATGVLLESNMPMVLTNAGLIDAWVGIRNFGASVVINNSGNITGDVLLGDAAETINNTGNFGALVDMGGGNDVYVGAAHFEFGPNVFGGAGDDSLTGGAGDDGFNGGLGNDYLNGAGGDDLLEGGDGNDRLVGGQGDDDLDGGAGVDQADYRSSAAAVVVNLLAGTATGAGSDTLTGIENVQGSAFADTITGDAGANSLNGHAGNDILDGGEGDDTLIGGAGADVMTGGGGVDYASYINATAGVGINLKTGVTTGDAAGDTFAGIERFRLSALADTFTGGNGDDYVTGAEGADNLRGGNGADFIDGGADIDWLRGDAGNDQLLGDAGDDVLEGGAGADQLFGGAGTDYASYATAVTIDMISGVKTGDAAGDTFDSIERFRLSAQDDSFFGSKAADWVAGYTGADTLSGDGGADTLNGGLGADTLSGGEGNDKLIGEGGDDVLTGGLGDDAFKVTAGMFGNDTITDFGLGADLIRVTGVAGVDDISDLTIAQAGANTLITFPDGSTITLTGVSAATVDGADFSFG